MYQLCTIGVLGVRWEHAKNSNMQNTCNMQKCSTCKIVNMHVGLSTCEKDFKHVNVNLAPC